VKSYYNAGKYPDLYYYRDIDKKEIDLLIKKEGQLFPIEIKKAKNPSHADKNINVLRRFNKQIERGLIICLNDELIPYSKDTWYCPISLI